MKTSGTIARGLAIWLLATGAVILFFGEEKDAELPAFLLHVLFDKALAIGMVICAVMLHRRGAAAQENR